MTDRDPNAEARDKLYEVGLDMHRMRDVIQEALHAAFIPVWSLTPGLSARGDDAGLVVLSNEGDELVTIPWTDVPIDT